MTRQEKLNAIENAIMFDKSVEEILSLIKGLKTIASRKGQVEFLRQARPNLDISYFDMTTEELKKHEEQGYDGFYMSCSRDWNKTFGYVIWK